MTVSATRQVVTYMVMVEEGFGEMCVNGLIRQKDSGNEEQQKVKSEGNE